MYSAVDMAGQFTHRQREFVVKIKDYEMKCDVNMYVISTC